MNSSTTDPKTLAARRRPGSLCPGSSDVDPLDRREFLGQIGTGLGAIALGALIQQEAAAAGTPATHFAPRAKRVIQVFCPGAVSQLDTFDYKPELIQRHGQEPPGGKVVTFQGANGNLMKSPWAWAQHGESGRWVTEILPHLAKQVDRMAFFHAMTARSNTHGPAMLQMNTGFFQEGFPSAGSWVTYALGSLTDNLPAFVAIPDVRGLPPNGPNNWNAGFLPAAHQAASFNTERGIEHLESPPGATPAGEERVRGFIQSLNRRHQSNFPGQSELSARIRAYELAAKMQMTAPEVMDLGSESEATLKLYGADGPNEHKRAFARNAILARRLLERGVRFVQLYCGGPASQVDGLLNWDAHKTLKPDYERHAPILDQPLAALLQDLDQRGLLADTLVLWCTEFGRMPTHQSGSEGRDHNPDAFTVWMAGAGVKGGTAYGATDEFGQKAVENITTIYDFHATVLHLLGLDHERLTYYHNGIQRRLTDVHGHVIRDVLA